MAQIKMDISEYEAMKENKKLLEASLENERKLQDEVKKLSEEKIKALEEAKMKVVKITKISKHEHVLVKRPDNNYIFHKFMNLLGINIPPHAIFPSNFNINELIDSFFEKQQSISQPCEEITTHGLDEIKSEIREDLKAQLNDDIKSKIERADKALTLNNELLTKIENIESENYNLKLDNTNLMLEIRELKEKIKTFDKLKNYITELQGNISLFNFKSKFKQLNNLNNEN